MDKSYKSWLRTIFFKFMVPWELDKKERQERRAAWTSSIIHGGHSEMLESLYYKVSNF